MYAHFPPCKVFKIILILNGCFSKAFSKDEKIYHLQLTSTLANHESQKSELHHSE